MDGADTGVKTNANDTVAFKFVVNDYYAKDISVKVSSVKAMKATQGQFQGNTAPYGYKKSPDDKNKLVIDENVAPVIKKIFELYISGKSGNDIARMLTEERIKSPSKYLDIPIYRSNIDQWTAKSILRTITNQVYIGNMVGLKTKKISYKIDKCVSNKKENYVLVENTHEAIIEKEIFEEANRILTKKQVIRKRKHDDMLKGLMYCQECGSVMTLKVNNKINQHSFLCSKANKSRKSVFKPCNNFTSISSPKVFNRIMDILQNEFTKIGITEKDIEKSINNIQKITNVNKDDILYKIENIKDKMIELDKEVDSLYKDKVKQIISIDDFSRMYDNVKKEKLHLQERINNLQKELNDKDEKPYIDIKKIKKLLTQFLDCKEPSKELLFKLIDKIKMDKNRNLTVKFNFH